MPEIDASRAPPIDAARRRQRSTGRRGAGRLGCAGVLAGCSLWLAACKHGPSAGELRGAQYQIRKVEFEGVERFEPAQLHPYLELRPRQWLPPRRYWFYEGLIPSDVERLESVYHAHGYYEAQVVDVRVDPVARRRRDQVDLVFVIDEGPLTRVDEVVIRWPEGPPPGPPRSQRGAPLRRAPPVDPQRVSDQVVLSAGDPFEIEQMNASSAALRDHLRRIGHPFAEVDEHALVDRAARSAALEFEVRPGPFMRIGAVSITGLSTVPERPVRNLLEDAIGKPYSPALIEGLEQRVYGLDVFSTVSIATRPATVEAGIGTLALELAVRESDPQRVRLGLALGFEPNRWTQRFSARYVHQNLFRQLYQVRLTGRAGYAELPNAFNPIAHGPTAELDFHVEKQGLLEKYLVWTLDPRIELGIEQGYQFWTGEHRFGVSRFFTRWFQLRLSHTLRYVDFFSVSSSLRGQDQQTFLGFDFRDPYIISYLGVTATLFAVDMIAAPTNGAVLQLEYRVAGGPLGGQYDFHELRPVVRGYWRPIERLALAARAQIGLIFPFGDQPGAPIDMRRYLGGGDTVRGWGLRRLAPRIDDCEPGQDPQTGACDSIPIGGNSSVLANFEVRVRTWRQLWIAGFVDAGDVQSEPATFVPAQWNYSAGGGLRYDSPIGKFRLDLGVRLNATPLSAGEPVWALHLGLGESF
ncbi:Outer membrane protein assembly factor YaeT precursor [Enhygromyxa salina]|uniref:Outer membrane protein assembly factor YaeT n=1 Tax=Enhygromyxa salina TaxID=215803 RepID=A0A0C1Z8F3_9BACT|nr:BamA/TamA family outer membrane protein [Enhygromyxa salina]KIG13909.1 Outer membrane protein assembly factor YaeT precursor [Enhygromyxa salina]